MITSGNDDKTALGLLGANALPRFAPVSGALPGFFESLAVVFDTICFFI